MVGIVNTRVYQRDEVSELDCTIMNVSDIGKYAPVHN